MIGVDYLPFLYELAYYIYYLPPTVSTGTMLYLMMLIVFLSGDSQEIYLEVLVDEKLAYRFNCGHDNIDDILVLHLLGGKDFFVSFLL